MAERKFEVVGEIPDASPRESFIDRAGTQTLILGLKTLSQRTVAAVSELLSVGSAFVLWYLHPDPNAYQIASLSIYALFVLACVWMVRRR